MLRYYSFGGRRHTQSSNPQRAAQNEELAEATFSLALPANPFLNFFLISWCHKHYWSTRTLLLDRRIPQAESSATEKQCQPLDFKYTPVNFHPRRSKPNATFSFCSGVTYISPGSEKRYPCTGGACGQGATAWTLAGSWPCSGYSMARSQPSKALAALCGAPRPRSHQRCTHGPRQFVRTAFV